MNKQQFLQFLKMEHMSDANAREMAIFLLALREKIKNQGLKLTTPDRFVMAHLTSIKLIESVKLVPEKEMWDIQLLEEKDFWDKLEFISDPDLKYIKIEENESEFRAALLFDPNYKEYVMAPVFGFKFKMPGYTRYDFILHHPAEIDQEGVVQYSHNEWNISEVSSGCSLLTGVPSQAIALQGMIRKLQKLSMPEFEKGIADRLEQTKDFKIYIEPTEEA